MAKDLESRIVPGVGTAGIPVPQSVREQLTAHQDLDTTIRDLKHFVDTHTTLVPGTPEYNVGAQKSMDLQTKVRSGKLKTVYREGEQPLLDKFVSSNPAGMFKYLRTTPQLNELLGSNTRSMNVLKKSYQLPTPQGVDASGNYVPRNATKIPKGQ